MDRKSRFLLARVICFCLFLPYFLFFILCFITTVGATVPHYINYQGKLTTASGEVVTDATYSITFRLYAAQTGGSALWTETQSVTTSSGVFNLALGTVTALNLDFDSEYWLSVQVGTDSEMTPRQRITAAGYAINTDDLDTYTSGQFLRSDAADVYNEDGADVDLRFEGDSEENLLFLDASTGRIGIGTASPAQELDISGDIQVSQNITLSGTTAELWLGTDTNLHRSGAGTIKTDGAFVAAGTVTADSFIGDGSSLTGITSGEWTDDGTVVYPSEPTLDNVAIGGSDSSAPIYLEVGGAGTFSSDLTLSGTGSALFFPDGTSQTSAATGEWTDGGSYVYPSDGDEYVATSDSGDREHATGDGDLYVEDDIEIDGDLYLAGTANLSGELTLSGTNMLYLADGSFTAPSLAFSSDMNTGLYRPAADTVGIAGGLTVGQDDTGYDVTFYGATSGAYMLWDESADQLEVAAAAATSSISTSTTDLILDPGGNDVVPGSDDTDSLGTSTLEWKDLYIDGTAYIDNLSVEGGLSADLTLSGTTSSIYLADGSAAHPSLTFQSDSDTGLIRATTDTLGITTKGSERLRVDDSGNVGMGTTAPTYKLEVADAVKIDGSGTSVFADSVTIGTDSHGSVDLGTGTASDLYVKDDLEVDGAVNIEEALGIVESAPSGTELYVAGDAGISGDLTVGGTFTATGATTLSGDLTVSGTTSTLYFDDGATLSGDLTVGSTTMLYLADGTATAPSLTFISDTNTGLFRPTTDTLGIAAGGTDTLRISKDGSDNATITNTSGDVHVGSGGGDLTLASGVDIITEGNVEFKGDSSSRTITIGDTDKDNDDIVVIDASNWSVGASGDLTISGTTGAFYLADGTAANPSLNFSDDADTGLFSPDADEIAISIGGSEALRVDASGNVGIGDTTPDAKLDVEGDVVITQDLSISGTIYGSYHHYFPAQSAKLPFSNPAVIDASSNHYKLLFDGSTNESCSWQGIMHAYDGANIWVDIKCAMASETSGDVAYKVHFTPESAGVDIDAPWWESMAAASEDVPATLGDIVTLSAELTASGTSLATGDWFKLKLERDAATDSSTGDAEVVGVMLRSPR